MIKTIFGSVYTLPPSEKTSIVEVTKAN